jgi:hypothetical protein
LYLIGIGIGSGIEDGATTTATATTAGCEYKRSKKN